MAPVEVDRIHLFNNDANATRHRSSFHFGYITSRAYFLCAAFPHVLHHLFPVF